MKSHQPQLGELLKGYRAKRALTQEGLADLAQIDVRTIRRIEGGHVIQETKLGAICAALDLDLHELKLQAADLRQTVDLKRQTSQPKAERAESQRGRSRNDTPFYEISSELDLIDEKVANAFGDLKAPTRSDDLISFSSRRLISSLSSLGIPLEITLHILTGLPDELQRTVHDLNFSTNHIRSAVARIISNLSSAMIESTESYKVRRQLASQDKDLATISAHEIKFDWASRYARRYGSPDQVIRILERDGSVRKLDYAFLRTELIPHAMQKILGDGFSIGLDRLIKRSVIDEMARSALEEFKRLGLYSLRYKTALLLLVDLAIHPPHPWMVTPETRASTITYDLGRAVANLGALEDETAESGWDTGYRYNEVLHHLCSAILAVYNGFLGHRASSSVHLLKHWLNLEEDNIVLWRACDLRMIESDLAEIKLSKMDFVSLLKRMDLATRGADRKDPTELADYGRRLLIIARALDEVRSRMNALRAELEPGRRPEPHVLEAMARETAVACLGCKKVIKLHGVQGFRALLKVDQTVLAGRSAITILLLCFDPQDGKEVAKVIKEAVRQLTEYSISDSCIILCADEPGPVLTTAVAQASRELSRPAFIRAASILAIREKMRRSIPVDDIIDDIFYD